MPKYAVVQIEAFTTPGRYHDGDGLCLNIARGGSKSWVLRKTLNGRRRDFGLGGYPKLGLADARSKASHYRSEIAAGRDPRLKIESPEVPTFRQVALDFHAIYNGRWRSEKHTKVWLRRLELYAFPHIGHIPIDQVSRQDVLAVLTPIWTSKSDTARRVRQYCGSVFKSVVTQEYRTDDPAGESLDGLLLPMPGVKKHLRSLPYAE